MPNQQVFLSYARVDEEKARALRDDLLVAGFNVWWDQMIKPGQDWRFEIRQAMSHSYAVVLCFSSNVSAKRRSGIYPEVQDAINIFREYRPGEIFLIPVRFSECEIPDIALDKRRMLDYLQCVDLFPRENQYPGMMRLCNSLREAFQITQDPENIGEGKVEVEIFIGRNFHNFSSEDQDQLFRAFGEFLQNGNSGIIRKRLGRVKLTLKLSPTWAKKLFWEIESGKYEEFGVTDARMSEGDESDLVTLDPGEAHAAEFTEPEIEHKEEESKRKKEVYISYALGKESEKLASQLEIAFQEGGIPIFRDTGDRKTRESIKQFMKKTGKSLCVIVVISKEYLESENYMFKLAKIVRNGDFIDRVFPYLLDDVKISDWKELSKYKRYWKRKIQKYKKRLKGAPLPIRQQHQETIDQYTENRNTIALLTDRLTDIYASPAEMLSESGFAKLIEAVLDKLAE